MLRFGVKLSIIRQIGSRDSMNSRKSILISSLILSVLFAFNMIPALADGISDEIPPTLPEITNQQNTATTTAIYLPIIQVPKKSNPQVNVPYFSGDIKYSETAIFWFGKVTPTDNYADVRIGYNDTELYINVSIFDRRLWYDTDPIQNELAAWDATTLYLNLNGDIGSAPGTSAYKFVNQLNWWEERPRWQASYRGNGTGWSPTSIQYSAISGWRGNAPNDNNDDRGWSMTYRIPFTSLALSGPPSEGSIWGLAVNVHDRDDSAGTPISDKIWPPTQIEYQPESWGQLRFGLPAYIVPAAAPTEVTTIRHKLDGAVVTDAEVGGHTVCGQDYSPTFFDGWGDANYAYYDQVNVQNQSDVSDWPCFSKIYLDFPLPASLTGKSVLSANLRVYQFGGSDPANAKPSLIQVMTVKNDWDEGTITWNNAPLAQENISQAWAYPILQFPGWPGVPIDWDVSRAVSEAINNGYQNLRLVLI